MSVRVVGTSIINILLFMMLFWLLADSFNGVAIESVTPLIFMTVIYFVAVTIVMTIGGIISKGSKGKLALIQLAFVPVAPLLLMWISETINGLTLTSYWATLLILFTSNVLSIGIANFLIGDNPTVERVAQVLGVIVGIVLVVMLAPLLGSAWEWVTSLFE